MNEEIFGLMGRLESCGLVHVIRDKAVEVIRGQNKKEMEIVTK